MGLERLLPLTPVFAVMLSGCTYTFSGPLLPIGKDRGQQQEQAALVQPSVQSLNSQDDQLSDQCNSRNFYGDNEALCAELYNAKMREDRKREEERKGKKGNWLTDITTRPITGCSDEFRIALYDVEDSSRLKDLEDCVRPESDRGPWGSHVKYSPGGDDHELELKWSLKQ